MYMYPFFPKPSSHPGCHITLKEFHVLYSRTLLAFHFDYSSVYMSIQNSLTIHSPYHTTATISSFSKSAVAAAAAKSPQLYPTLCDPLDGSPPGSAVPGILQARTLEWVTISFSSAWKWKVKVKWLRRAWLLATPWTAAYQAPRSWDFPGKSTGVGWHCFLPLSLKACLCFVSKFICIISF